MEQKEAKQPTQQQIQSVRGMNDLLPQDMPYWHHVEHALRRVATIYGYQEIRFPLVESTGLFTRSIGEVTDIVEKEMYTFPDRNGDNLTLRPEGTAGCVRSCIQHNLLYNQTQRLWYMGPMFRHERPQKGRFRQFHQFGIEAFGFAAPYIDAELLLLSARLWQMLGIKDKVSLQINTLGSEAARIIYRRKLVEYFTEHSSELDEDSKRRLHTNPLRILDSKNPDMHELINKAPKLIGYLDAASQAHFAKLRHLLEIAGVEYTINPCLVRGLDYYCETVFEWVITAATGAQNTVCAGGHYDKLVEQLGGKTTSAIGFALGMERLIDLVRTSTVITPSYNAYLVTLNEQAYEYGLALSEQLRSDIPKLELIINHGGGNFATQLKRADKSNAELAIIIGEEELKEKKVSVKWLRQATPRQETIATTTLPDFLKNYLGQQT
jgi:histidyl-tRNA synthetase